jgi:hypothetical protein
MYVQMPVSACSSPSSFLNCDEARVICDLKVTESFALTGEVPKKLASKKDANKRAKKRRKKSFRMMFLSCE